MKKISLNLLTLLVLMAFLPLTATAQSASPSSDEVLSTLQKANDYFMAKWEDPTVATFVKKLRPSSLWTRAVYYEGLMALYEIDPQTRYADYVDRWASFHKWTPRDGITTCDADNQCCSQIYLERFRQVGGNEKLTPTKQNLDHQMQTPNKKPLPKNKWKNDAQTSDGELYGWWTWIDAIQMAMPVYAQMTAITGEGKYLEHGMKMYIWSRDTLAGSLFNEKEGLWWRDADYVPPYREPDGQQCYWSRGNGWVYAALVRVLQEMNTMKLYKASKRYYKLLKKDFIAMSKALMNCQRSDGLWNVSLVSDNYAGKELTGTGLFLYGMSWGINNGLLPAKKYRAACDRAWLGMQKDCVHADGFLGWVQGTGKDPSAGQPLSYTKVPDFEDFGTGCFLLGGAEYYKLLKSGK
ncbi:MAG: glycoside hydrolase family 88 protein [Prevotella sp.]|nr:glycoside hydrolase family 88 protein [Prevotella sp.]